MQLPEHMPAQFLWQLYLIPDSRELLPTKEEAVYCPSMRKQHARLGRLRRTTKLCCTSGHHASLEALSMRKIEKNE